MTELFLKLLDLSFVASYVAVVIMIIRLFLKKAPKIFSYVLWLILLFRLICPFSIESNFSLIKLQSDMPKQNLQMQKLPKRELLYTQNRNISLKEISSDNNSKTPTEVTKLNEQEKPLNFIINTAAKIWIIGIIILFIYTLFVYIKLKRKLTTATLVEENIYETDQIKTPFVLGLMKPIIYIPTDLSEKDFDYVRKHEQTHIKRFDPFIKLIAYGTFILYWFNPIMWVSYTMMVKDMEMSCDETVMNKYNSDIRESYCRSLLSLSEKQSGLFSPLAFGESNIKSRIKNILNYKKPTLWIVVSSILLVMFMIVGLITNPKIEKAIEQPKQAATYTPSPSVVLDKENSKTEGSNHNNYTDEVKEIVEKNMDIIMSSPKESSNPQDYINDHSREYDAILKQGDNALNYILSQFETGNNNNLRGNIMMLLCKDLLGDRNNVEDDTLQPQEWFDALSIRKEIILPDFKYTGTDETEQLVYDTVIKQQTVLREGGFVITAIKIHGSYKEDNELKIFVTVHSNQYKLYENVLSDLGGSTIPVAITYKKNNDGSYTLEKYEQSKDGSYFEPSIREYCTMPVSEQKIKGLADKILAYYKDYNDLMSLERENLITYLKFNHQENVILKSFDGKTIHLAY